MLHEALAIEYGFSRHDSKAMDKLIDGHPDLVFEFSLGPVVENLRPAYTERTLNAVRRALADLDNEAILAGFGPKGELRSLVAGWEQPAVAHVLLERGLAVGRGDFVPQLIVRRTDCRP